MSSSQKYMRSGVFCRSIFAVFRSIWRHPTFLIPFFVFGPPVLERLRLLCYSRGDDHTNSMRFYDTIGQIGRGSPALHYNTASTTAMTEHKHSKWRSRLDDNNSITGDLKVTIPHPISLQAKSYPPSFTCTTDVPPPKPLRTKSISIRRDTMIINLAIRYSYLRPLKKLW